MKAAVGLALMLVVAPCAGPVSAAPPNALPDATTLLARSAAAGGPAPANYREIVVAGDETRTIYHRDGDERTVIERGPVRTEEGIASSSVRRISAPVAGYLVETFDANGYGMRRLLDAQTLLPRRVERIEPSGTTVTTYDEFATFGARVLPTRWTIQDARTSRTVTETLAAYAEETVAPEDVAVPPIRRDLVAFPAGAHEVTLPARFIRDRVYMQVGIAGRSLDFVLDTGESGIAIAADTVRELGLAGAPDAAIAPLVTVGPLAMHDVVMTTIPHVPERPAGNRIDGILGFDFLASLGVTIDYVRAKVTVVPATLWSPPKGRNVVRLPVRLANGIPTPAPRPRCS